MSWRLVKLTHSESGTRNKKDYGNFEHEIITTWASVYERISELSAQGYELFLVEAVVMNSSKATHHYFKKPCDPPQGKASSVEI